MLKLSAKGFKAAIIIIKKCFNNQLQIPLEKKLSKKKNAHTHTKSYKRTQRKYETGKYSKNFKNMLLVGLSSKVEMTEQNQKIEDKLIEFIQYEKQREKQIEKEKQNLRDLWDNDKKFKIPIIRIVRREKNGTERE